MTVEQARREFDADVAWLPYFLHPEYPPEGISLADLHRRYGIGSGDRDPLRRRFEAAGLEYNRPEVVPNTLLALRVSELARDHELHEPFHNRLMDAYWAEGVNVGDPDELRRLAGDVGLDAADVERVIGDPAAYLELVLETTREAQSLGIRGIPAFVLDKRLLMTGAQPLEVFRQAFADLAA